MFTIDKPKMESLQDINTQSDLWMLGLHLHNDHGKTDQNAFDPQSNIT